MHHVPTANDMVINTYNTTGLDDDTKEEGFVMTSQYATAEFTLVAAISLVAKQMMVFPCFPALNCHGSILVSSPQLSKNIFSTSANSDGASLTSVLAKVPVNVNQGQIINYQPTNPIKMCIGQQEIESFDIRITDLEQNLIDFNGVGHDMCIVFKVWDKVGIPLNRQQTASYPNRHSDTAAGIGFSQRHQLH